MHRPVSIAFAAVVAGGMFVLGWGAGCSSSSDSGGNNDSGVGGDGGGCDPACDSINASKADPKNPPATCGPCGISPSSTGPVDGCPKNGCMSQATQSGNVLNYRMGRIRLWSPSALLSLAALAVDPNVNPVCYNGGAETFNWLMQIDTAGNTIKTGGAGASSDHKTFAFLDETVHGSDLSGICPSFTGGADIHIAPISLPVTFDSTGKTFATQTIDQVNIPIFDAATGIPVILPIRAGILKNVTISDDKNCIGKWDAQYWTDGDTLGWTTAGVLTGYITAEDADNVPVKTAACQSLCAILANDATKTTGGRCKRGTDGKVLPGIGSETTPDGQAAFLLSATFAAYGVNITGTTTGDSGPGDTGGGDAPADGG
jgi:hypothetical protein